MTLNNKSKEADEDKKTIEALKIDNEKLQEDNRQFVEASKVMEEIVNQYKS